MQYVQGPAASSLHSAPLVALGALRPLRLLVVDTCVLRNDVLRRARRWNEPPGRMISASAMRTVRILTTPHVVQEMNKDIRRFAQEAGQDADRALAVWSQQYLPELVVVDVGDLVGDMAGDPLVARTLARHPQDAPLAVLCTLLRVRALSEDRDLGQLSTGRPWLQHVIAVSDAGMADSVTAASMLAGEISVRGMAAGAQRSYDGLRRVAGPTGAKIVVFVLAVALIAVLLHEGTRRRLASTVPVQLVRESASALGGGVVTVVVRGAHGDAFLRATALPEGRPILPVAALVRLLAEAHTPQTTEAIAVALGADRGLVEIMLDAHLCFRPAEDGRWQLGSRHCPPQTY